MELTYKEEFVMNGRQLQALAVSGIFGLVGGALSIQFVGTRAAHAQPPQQEHLRVGSLRIVHGQATVAALSTYPPDNATKLILRDKNGRQGLILSVSDAPGTASRADRILRCQRQAGQHS